MKRYILAFLLTLFFTGVMKGQQNLFNIPSGDITNSDSYFYQHQLNLYSNKLESKAHFVYGLGNGWDAGINVVGKGAYFSPEWRILHNDNPDKGSLYPIVMGTVQKQFALNDFIDINVGSQIGYNISHKLMNKEINYFAYGLGVFYFMNKKSRVVAGLYQTNKEFVGHGNTFGAMLGYELKVSERFYLMGDWMSGSNDAAVSVIGAMYNASKRIQLCAGWQIPNPNTPKPSGLVFEVNLLGWDLYK
jgi:hypothetical protein